MSKHQELAERRGNALANLRAKARAGKGSMIQSAVGFGLAFVGGAILEGMSIGPAPVPLLVGIGGAIGRAATAGSNGIGAATAYGAEAIGHGWTYLQGKEVGGLGELFDGLFGKEKKEEGK